MVFLFDSLCAAVLLMSAILSGWVAGGAYPGARVNLRFAAMMMALCSAAPLMPSTGLALDVALVTPCLAASTAVLALSFPRRAALWLSCLLLVAGLVAGLLAALKQMPSLALGFQAGAALVLAAWCASRLEENPHAAILAGLGAASLFFGAMAVMNGTLDAAMMFFAVFLLLAARASKAAVVYRHRRQRQLLISGSQA